MYLLIFREILDARRQGKLKVSRIPLCNRNAFHALGFPRHRGTDTMVSLGAIELRSRKIPHHGGAVQRVERMKVENRLHQTAVLSEPHDELADFAIERVAVEEYETPAPQPND
ncbi:hypothetical protein [Salipiger mangrovisoli]|uniref:Uncharacterized protein n=1 Tax=Salipiger mangrovisoli TaxID=2865933 RepID=A0ABR9X5C9_9RHOB|nr:hypothetical protein [Salipiger mangrovisoli]MBE9638742.1 hypothetical protein [Salipiger mangrovisoli]